VYESILVGDKASIEDGFAAWSAALETCAGRGPSKVAGGDTVEIELLDEPVVGEQSVAFARSQSMGSSQFSYRMVVGLMNGGESGLAAMLGVQLVAPGVGPGEQPSAAIAADWSRLATAAPDKIAQKSADVGPLTVEPISEQVLLDEVFALPGLLTTDEIGGGWVDLGRNLVAPPVPVELCSKGTSIEEDVLEQLMPLVSTTFRRAASPQLLETVKFGPRDELAAAFETWVGAANSCVGEPAWGTWTAGPIALERADLTVESGEGGETAAYRVIGGADPVPGLRIEEYVVRILVPELDPSNDMAAVITLQTFVVVGEAVQPVPTLDVEELTRVAQAAVDKLAWTE
jgi:hypothetical protein